MNIKPIPSPAMLPVRTVAHLPWPVAERVFVIAEIGINHNGDMALAKQLIDVAQAAGCDAVKFQKRTIDVVYTSEVLDQPRKSPWGNTQRAQKQGLEFGEAQYDEIDDYCRKLGIDWFASAWDVGSQAFLAKYKLRYNKIASAMLTNRALVETVAAERKLTFMSTGMCTLDEIDAAVELMRAAECPFILMHTVSTYPTPVAELNLMAMETLRKRYSAPVGYSGHETSLEPTIMAAVLGAVAIERHITLDRSMYGSDQSASLQPDELHTLVDQLRVLPQLLGDGEKRITSGEAAVAKKLRYWPSTQDILQPVR